MPGPEAVLVVEDNCAALRVMCRALSAAGMRVLPASSREDALSAADRDQPLALLLTDVILPDCNGSELAVDIRRKHPGIRVLFMTGYGEEELRSRGLDPAAMSLLYKPFLPDTLVDAVRASLAAGQRRTYLR